VPFYHLLSTSGYGASGFQNDADGNTLSGNGRTNAWDSQNRLVSCLINGNTTAYRYGADGLRRQATKNGGSTDSAYDGSMLVREGHASGGSLTPATVTATYFIGARGPEYRRDDTQTEIDSQGRTVTKARWYVFDGLGSVVGEVDASGNLTSSPKYDVYGAVRANGGTASSKQGFVGALGHVSDDTGLVYMRARYYDANLGRFTSEDPSKNGMNWYVYASDNPINSVDANGKVPFSIAVQSANLWEEMWLAADDGATVGDLLQMFNGDVYFAAGSQGALDPRVVSGILRFDAPLDEVLENIGNGIEYDHFPDMFLADEGGINSLARVAGEGELLDMESGVTMAVLTEL